jgi:hypothetical protein
MCLAFREAFSFPTQFSGNTDVPLRARPRAFVFFYAISCHRGNADHTIRNHLRRTGETNGNSGDCKARHHHLHERPRSRHDVLSRRARPNTGPRRQLRRRLQHRWCHPARLRSARFHPARAHHTRFPRPRCARHSESFARKGVNLQPLPTLQTGRTRDLDCPRRITAGSLVQRPRWQRTQRDKRLKGRISVGGQRVYSQFRARCNPGRINTSVSVDPKRFYLPLKSVFAENPGVGAVIVN